MSAIDPCYIALRPRADMPDPAHYYYVFLSEEQVHDIVDSANVLQWKYSHIRDDKIAQALLKLDTQEAVEAFFFQYYSDAPRVPLYMMNTKLSVFVWSDGTWYVMSRLLSTMPTLHNYLSI